MYRLGTVSKIFTFVFKQQQNLGQRFGTSKMPPPPYRWLWAAVRSKAVVLLLLICCLVCFPLVVGVLCVSLFCCSLFFVLSIFAIILKRNRKRIPLSYRCGVTVNVLSLFLTVPWFVCDV